MKAKESNTTLQTFLIVTAVLAVVVVFVGSLFMRTNSVPFFFGS